MSLSIKPTQNSNSARESSQFDTHYDTVHTLIQQNEELNARMNLNLRRAAQVEIKLKKLEDAYDMTTRQNDALIHETDLLKEKTNSTERLFIVAHSQKEELQKTFAELYARSRETEAQLKIELSRAEDKVALAQTFRRRVLKYVKPSLKKNKDRELLQEKQIASLRTEMNRTRQQQHDIGQTLEMERKDKQESDQAFEHDLSKLALNYEEQLCVQKDELENLKQNCDSLKQFKIQLSSRIEGLEDDRIRFQNESIRETRKSVELKNEKQNLFEANEERFTAHRLHIQSLEIEVANLKEMSKASYVRAQAAEATNSRFSKQAGEQQLIQEETLTTLQNISEREAKSARLNVELSRALKETRAEIERLNIESTAMNISAAQALKEIEIHHSPPAQETPSLKSDINAEAEESATANSSRERLGERIESILSEIQGSQYLPQDWIESEFLDQRSSSISKSAGNSAAKFIRPGKGIIVADVEVEPMELESECLSEAIEDVTDVGVEEEFEIVSSSKLKPLTSELDV